MRKHNTFFDLSISFEGFEVKGVTINLKNFLFLNEKISSEISDLCRYNFYVNFAETILDGMRIEGKIETIFNYKRFIRGLKKFQLKHKSSWKGHFTYNDTQNSFIFKAPDFKKDLI